MHAGLVRPTVATLATALVLGLAACGGKDGRTATGTVAPVPAATPSAASAAGSAPAARKKVTAADLKTPQRVVATYLSAFSTGDGRAVCRTYTKAQQRRIARSFQTTCARGIAQAFETGGGTAGFEQGLGSLRVGEAQVSGRKAVVQLVPIRGGAPDPGLAVKLARTGREWLIARPSGG